MTLRLIYQTFSKLLGWIVLRIRSETTKEIEILVLRHQLAVLQRPTAPTDELDRPRHLAPIRVSGQRRQALGSVSCSEVVVERPPAGRADELLNDDADLAQIDRARGGGAEQRG